MKHEPVSAGEQYLKYNLTNRFFSDARLSREFSIREPDLDRLGRQAIGSPRSVAM